MLCQLTFYSSFALIIILGTRLYGTDAVVQQYFSSSVPTSLLMLTKRSPLAEILKWIGLRRYLNLSNYLFT